MSEHFPEEETDAAREGTLAHDTWAQMLKGVTPDVDDEMLEGARMFCEELWTIQASTPGLHWHIESYIPCKNVHPDNGGTPDAWAYDSANNIVYIADYKYGHGYVDHVANWQLLNYWAGISRQITADGRGNNRRVEFIIVQPRCYHRDGPVRRWNVAAVTLNGYIEHMKKRYDEATGKDPKCETGPECCYCPGRHACESLLKADNAARQFASTAVPLDMSNDALSVELMLSRHFAELLESRITGLEATIQAKLKAGERVPGWALEPTAGRLKWTDEDGAIAMAEMLGVTVTKRALITPTQAIKAGLPKDVVDLYTERPAGTPKLQPLGDKLLRIFK